MTISKARLPFDPRQDRTEYGNKWPRPTSKGTKQEATVNIRFSTLISA